MKKKLLSIVMSTNNNGVEILFSRQGLTEAESEREQQRAGMNEQSSSQEGCKRERARSREWRQNNAEEYRDSKRVRARERRLNNIVYNIV